MTNVIVAAVVACIIAAISGRFLIPVLRALKAGQSIREEGPTWHNAKAGTPMMGGLIFVFSTVVVLIINAFKMEEYSALYVLAMALGFGIIGFLDDFTKMKYKRNLGLTSLQKAGLQMAMSAVFLYVLYRTGTETDLYIPFADVSIRLHPVVYIFFAMFVMVGCDNAVNLTDGVDGLCGSVTVPVMVFFTAAAVKLGRWDLALLPAALAGGLIAYLFYNWHPAKVFMGDTGSLFLGGVICGLAFALEMPLILILVGFVYICETLSVILQVGYFKLTHGERLFKMSPIHHHFEMCGWKEEKICFIFTGITVVMCVLAWLGISGLAA